MTQTDTLEKYGPEFQAKVLSALIQDVPFVQQVHDVIDSAYFESDANKWIVEQILSYFAEYRKLPTASVFKLELDKVQGDVLKVSVEHHLKMVGRHISADDLDYVKDEFITFCRNQAIKKAILDSVDLAERQEFDEIISRFNDAVNAGAERDFGHDWKADVDSRLLEEVRDTIMTPWDCINNVIDGGLAGGELGVIAAPAGAGKSWMLAAIGANAMRKGKRVLQFTLELNDRYTGLRYDTIFTGIEPRELKNHYDEVKNVVSNIPGEIVIKYFPPQTVNCNRMYTHVQQMEAAGYKPDVILVDYGDLLRSIRKMDARYLELGSIYTELRSLAGELFVPIWTASQTQRSSIDVEIIQADKIAESYSKIMVADFVMSLSRTLNDRDSNTARVHVIKNRFGPDGMTFPVNMNVLEGKIDVYEGDSVMGQTLQEAMKNENIVKKLLYAKYKDHQDKKDLG
jgi:replicative DNA helicase